MLICVGAAVVVRQSSACSPYSHCIFAARGFEPASLTPAEVPALNITADTPTDCSRQQMKPGSWCCHHFSSPCCRPEGRRAAFQAAPTRTPPIARTPRPCNLRERRAVLLRARTAPSALTASSASIPTLTPTMSSGVALLVVDVISAATRGRALCQFMVIYCNQACCSPRMPETSDRIANAVDSFSPPAKVCGVPPASTSTRYEMSAS